MADQPAPAPAPAPLSMPGRSLWRRYLKARGSRVGLTLIVLFALTALLAPFIAHRLPIYWVDGATGNITFPLIREFFSPSDTTEAGLERGANFLLLYIPLALLAWKLMSKYGTALARTESRGISLLFGGLFSLVLWLAIGGMVVDGAGKSWFYAENQPVPETDEIIAPTRLLSPAPSGAAANEARTAVEARLRELGMDFAAAELPVEEAQRRLILPIQDMVDGPEVVPVSPLAGKPGIDALDITDANLDAEINRARWNRIVLETAYPGLLKPFREFRSAFLLLAAAALLSLVGLTYIFMAGAGQFVLSPRWLVLLGLAALVAFPFSLPVRYDNTLYRQLALEGKGHGLFPVVPYGPNEQGFGPELPPTWYADSPELRQDSVRDWDLLADELAAADTPGLAKIAAKLDEDAPGWRDAGRDRDILLTGLNRVLRDSGLFDADAFGWARGDRQTAMYVRRLEAGELDSPHVERLNRLLVQQTLPHALVRLPGSAWKKPGYLDGYHLFGTDEMGRDVLVRVVHGARVSLSVGFVSVFLATAIGLVVGSLAAYYGGWVDLLTSRFIEVMMCFPSFFLILAVIAILDKHSIINIMLVIGLTSWTGVARLIRGEMLRQRKMDYVSASIALGASDTRTIFRHILPNAMAPVLVSVSFGITGAILTEASLSFLGLGVTPPTPTWGQLLSETRASPLAYWWMALFPGAMLFFGVLAFNLVGEAIREALDPRQSL